MPITTLLLIVLIILVIGALPNWPYSRGWGYYPSSGAGILLLILIILLLFRVVWTKLIQTRLSRAGQAS
jgi:hypothetical protein